MITGNVWRALVAGLGVAVLSGCSSLGPDESAAGDAALAFFVAVSGGDGVQACDLLTDDVQTELEQTSGAPCPSAILDEDLPAAERVTQVFSYGRNAQVIMDSDVLFLSVADGGWKIIAAGCRPHAQTPYDCSLTGG